MILLFEITQTEIRTGRKAERKTEKKQKEKQTERIIITKSEIISVLCVCERETERERKGK